MNTTDIKRLAAEHVKVGNIEALARLVESVAGALGQVTSRAAWIRGRQAKLKLLHESEYAKENKKAADLEAQGKEYSALLGELKAIKVEHIKPVAPTKPEQPKSPVLLAKKETPLAAVKVRAKVKK